MLSKTEYAPYFEQYIQLVATGETSILEGLEKSQKVFEMLLRDVPKEKQEYAYAADKWTVKEVIQHIIDTERIFCYRALCFARNDKTDLPGFDHDYFVENDTANERNYDDLLDEMAVLRTATILLYKSFSGEALTRIGTASNNRMSVRALGYLFSGHQTHHLNVLKERYL